MDRVGYLGLGQVHGVDPRAAVGRAAGAVRADGADAGEGPRRGAESGLVQAWPPGCSVTMTMWLPTVPTCSAVV